MSVRLDRDKGQMRKVGRQEATPRRTRLSERKGPLARLEMLPQSIENVRFGDGDGAMQATGFSANWAVRERALEWNAAQQWRSRRRKGNAVRGVDRVVESGIGGYLQGDAKRGRKLLKSLGAAAKLALKL